MTKALDATAGSRLKLHDLQVGQRFSFIGKHRGKVFEVTGKDRFSVVYMDVATGEDRMALSNRKTFRMDVWLEQNDQWLTPDERKLLDEVFSVAYLVECDEENREERKSAINALHAKLTGAKRVPEDVNSSPNV